MLSGLSVASCAAGRTAECAPAPPVGLPVCEISRGVCMRPDVRDFMRMGMSFLLAMCKNSHAARILEINSTNVRFFITNTLSGEHARISFSPFTTLDAPDGRLCRLSVGCATACPVAVPPRKKKPPCNRREVGDKGLWPSGYSGGLVYPLEIFD